MSGRYEALDAPLEDRISEEEAQLISLRLWQLLGEQTARYTMGDSSSVPLETAEALLASLRYTLDIALEAKGLPQRALAQEDLNALLKAGQSRLLEKKAALLSLWREVCACACPIENVYYRDTLKAFGGFFKHYDHLFFAQQVSPDLDYPLLLSVSETLCGLTYMRVYGERMLLENRILAAFPQRCVERLFCAAVPDYREMFFNLCEPVLTNAAGLAILRRDVRTLDIPTDAAETLCALLCDVPGEKLDELLKAAAAHVCAALGLQEKNVSAYIEGAMESLRPRLVNALGAGDLSHIFIGFLPENVGAAPY